MGRIAEQGDAPVRPTIERVTVDHRELVDHVVGPGDEVGDVEPRPVPVVEAGGEVGRVAGPVPVLAFAQADASSVELGDPVDRAEPVVVGLGDRIGDELVRKMPGHEHRPAGEERRPARRGPPEHVPAPVRQTLVRLEDGTHARTDAVGTDEQVGPVGRRRLVRAVFEHDAHGGTRRVVKRLQPAPGDHGVSADPPPDGIEQRHLQPPAVNRELWHGVTGREPAGLAPDELTVAVEEAQFGRLHAEGEQLVEQVQTFEHAHGVRQEVDADPERAQLAHRLVDLHLDARLVQRERGDEATDAPAGDDDPHARLPLSRARRRRLRRHGGRRRPSHPRRRSRPPARPRSAMAPRHRTRSAGASW